MVISVSVCGEQMCTIRFQHFHFNCRASISGVPPLEICQLHTWYVHLPIRFSQHFSSSNFETASPGSSPTIFEALRSQLFNGPRLKGSFRCCFEGKSSVGSVFVYVYAYAGVCRVAQSHTFGQVGGYVCLCVISDNIYEVSLLSTYSWAQ